jgi:predicted DNA-binding protein
MSVQMLIRIEPDLKEALNKLAHKEGKSTNHLVREIIKDFIKERDLSSYIENLWERIGNKLKSKGIKQEDISQAIKAYRKKKYESRH